MLDNNRDIISENRGLSKSRGLNALDRGLYDIAQKKTILKIFLRDDLFEEPKVDNKKKEDKKETDVAIDAKEKPKTPRKEGSDTLVTSSSSPSIKLKSGNKDNIPALNLGDERRLNETEDKNKIPKKKNQQIAITNVEPKKM